jgi:hypothetical protein
MKGALHVHSTFSDGEFTIAELRRIYVDLGCSFLCISDHAEAFTADALRKYVDECARNSDDQFLFIPSLEYECEHRMHILGYGCTHLVDTEDPQAVIASIESAGGLAVIAHPRDDMFPWIRSFARIPIGIEGWNSKYDGQYAPRTPLFALIRELQAQRADLKAFFGQDLHWRQQYRGLFTVVDTNTLDRELILESLARGRFHGRKDETVLTPDAQLSAEMIAMYDRDHKRSNSRRRFLKSGKKVLDAIGIKAPPALKARLRRLF